MTNSDDVGWWLDVLTGKGLNSSPLPAAAVFQGQEGEGDLGPTHLGVGVRLGDLLEIQTFWWG